jgi:hypothetical protein
MATNVEASLSELVLGPEGAERRVDGLGSATINGSR